MEALSRWQAGGPSSTSRLLVGTIALGAGIDNPHVRLVIHWGMTDSAIEYAQATGRASRDGRPGLCLTLLPLGANPSKLQPDARKPDQDVLTMQRLLGSTGDCLQQILTGYWMVTRGSDASKGSVNRVESVDPSPSELPMPAAKIAPWTALMTESRRDEESTGRSTVRTQEPTTSEDMAGLCPPLSSPMTTLHDPTGGARLHDPGMNGERGPHVCSGNPEGRATYLRWRSTLRWARYIGCFQCGQPPWICTRRGATGTWCRYQDLVVPACWMAWHHHRDRIQTWWTSQGWAEGRAAPSDLDDFQTWISRKTTLHNGEGSNAARLAEQMLLWLDKQQELDEHSVQEDEGRDSQKQEQSNESDEEETDEGTNEGSGIG
ncbi:MAG: hypothetical protein M1816_005097 [Peltula sp. TS41687]|nr:MAG: hypothetical protein M1816_005097 [Peltula sp. TS41687]